MHIKAVHEGIKQFKCKVSDCEFTCAQSSHLNQHVASVHEKIQPFDCPQCPKSCSTKGNLRQHIASVHNTERPFKCEICKTGFKESRGLKQHKKGCAVKQIENSLVGESKSIPSANLLNENSVITGYF